MIPILLTLLLSLAPPPCQALHAPAGEVTIRAYQFTGTIYTSESTQASNGIVTDTVTLRHGIPAIAPVRVAARRPYVFYVCQETSRPGVMYLPGI